MNRSLKLWCVLFGLNLHCSGAGPKTARQATGGSASGLAYLAPPAGFANVGVQYKSAARQLRLNSMPLTFYTAKLEGGVACFGDLYDNGTSKQVDIDVEGGERILLRKGAEDCQIALVSISFGSETFTNEAGLIVEMGERANFVGNDQVDLEVKVERGLIGAVSATDVSVELVGNLIERESSGKLENSELFVSQAGSAFVAPAVEFATGDITYFSERVYGSIACSFGEAAATACASELGKPQDLAAMSVWLTNDDLEALAADERFSTLETDFFPDGRIVLSTEAGMEGLQLAAGDGLSLGIRPQSFDHEEPKAYLVVRLSTDNQNSYKVFSLTPTP